MSLKLGKIHPFFHVNKGKLGMVLANVLHSVKVINDKNLPIGNMNYFNNHSRIV